MKRAWCLTIISVICMAVVAGCWNRRELNDIAVSVAIGVDQRANKILLSNQILNPGAISGMEGGSFAPVTMFQETGRGFQEAARRMTALSTRKIYVGQMQMLVFGEEFARKGISKVLDHISRDHEYRKDFYVVIARGAEAQDILQVYSPLEKTPASKMNASLETSSRVWGATAAVKINELISTLTSKGKSAVLTGIVVSGDKQIGNDKKNVEKILSPAQLKYSGLAVFKKDKLLGWLSEKESKGYNYTQGKIKSTVVLASCPKDNNKKIAVELLGTKSKKKVSIENGMPVIDLQVKTEGVVTDAQCELDFTKAATITEIEHLTGSEIKDTMISVIKKMQTKYKSDIFGFGEDVERENPRYWESAKSDWDQVFSTMKVNVRVEVKIRKMFKTTKSLTERMEE